MMEFETTGAPVYFKSYYKDGIQIATREGYLWAGMNQRTLVGGEYQKIKPTYIGVETSDNFKNFQYFAEWCQHQIGFLCKNGNGSYWQLDKDIVGNGKLYSENTCVFVPSHLNSFLSGPRISKHGLPTGITKVGNGFKARCSDGRGERIYLGYFHTLEEAAASYKSAKERAAREMAAIWQGRVDDRVVEKLLEFEL
jgi:hypothetical protein